MSVPLSCGLIVVVDERSANGTTKGIKMLRFVERIVRLSGEFSTWPELLTQWNKEKPRRAYLKATAGYGKLTTVLSAR